MATTITLSPSKKKTISARQILFLAVGAGFLIRMIVVVCTYRDLPDADKLYERFGWEMGWVARALASGHGFSSPYWPWSGPTAIESPLFPGLLSLVFRAFGIYSLTSGFVILTINSILSTLTCIPVYFSAKYSLGERGAQYAAVSVCDLLFSKPGLGVRADGTAVYDMLLHCAADSPLDKGAGVDRVWRSVRSNRALESVHYVDAAVSAGLCALPGAP
jgi:hypothetical protein